MCDIWRTALAASLALCSLARPAISQESVSLATTPDSAPSIAPLSEIGACPPVAKYYFSGEFLYFWPNREGLGTAVVNSSQDGMTFSTLESLNWDDGTPGFRIGARYCPSEIDFGATFTYFHAKTQQTETAPDGGSLTGTLATDRRARNAMDADSDAGLSYAVLDLDVGKEFWCSEAFGIRGFGGIRLASINQTLKSIYTGGALGAAADYVNSPVRFYGAGITAGLETTWKLYRGWGLYGRGRFGLISSYFDSEETETVGAALIHNDRETYYTIIPVAEMGAGLCYQGEQWSIRAGYEMTDWINMVYRVGGTSAQSPHRRGDLTIQALTLRLGYAF
jgi:hypothetical protein